MRLTVADVLRRLAEEGVASAGAAERARAAFEGADADAAPPWFARVIAGLGAWVATGFLVGFLVAADVVEGAASATIAGALLLVTGVVLRRAATPEQDFRRHFAVALSLAGQVLLVVGVSDATKSATAAGALAVVMSVALVLLVPDAAHRFMSAVIGSIAAVGMMANLRLAWTLGAVEPLGAFVVRGSDLAVLGVVAVTAYVWRGALRRRSDAAAEMLEPVGYGTIAALFGLMLFSTLFAFADEVVRGSRAARANAWHLGPLTTIGITAALVALELRAFAEQRVRPRAEAVAAAIAASMLLGALTLSTPGVMAAIAALALGFDRRNRILIGLAVIFLVHFASAYYYSLRMTLLYKSIVLVASGVVLLAARAYVEMRYDPREAEA